VVLGLQKVDRAVNKWGIELGLPASVLQNEATQKMLRTLQQHGYDDAKSLGPRAPAVVPEQYKAPDARACWGITRCRVRGVPAGCHVASRRGDGRRSPDAVV